jgi:hypothetical protein
MDRGEQVVENGKAEEGQGITQENQGEDEADIEEKHIKAGKHLEKLMADYRESLLKRFNSGLDIIFREIERLDLDAAELKRLKDAAKDAVLRINGNEE